LVDYKGDVAPILKEIMINVRSGMSYSGAFNLAELREQATFIRQTGSGFRESKPHILL